MAPFFGVNRHAFSRRFTNTRSIFAVSKARGCPGGVKLTEIRICFSLQPKSSMSQSQEPWLSAIVYGTCWRPEGQAVLESGCSQEVMGKKNWNRSALIACIKIRPTY